MSMKEKLHRWLQKNLKCAKNPEIKSWVLVGNRFSLLFHGLWAVILCFTIEIFSRRSVKGAWDFIADSPLAFLYNGLLVFVTFMPVYFSGGGYLPGCSHRSSGSVWEQSTEPY